MRAFIHIFQFLPSAVSQHCAEEQCPGELNTVIKLEPFLTATTRSRNHCVFMRIDEIFIISIATSGRMSFTN